MRYRDIRTDRSGGIEGLPLQLMIVIIVATMGIAIIVGWMGNLETPNSIGDVETSPLILEADEKTGVTDFTVTVRDQDGEFLEGAVVVFQNNFVSMADLDAPKDATDGQTPGVGENGDGGTPDDETSDDETSDVGNPDEIIDHSTLPRISASEETDERGVAKFGPLFFDLKKGTHTVEILVFKTGYGEKTLEVLVTV